MTGIGVSRKETSQLFLELAQLDSETKRKYKGTGHGLAICKRLCYMMDGYICIESTPVLERSEWKFLLLPVYPLRPDTQWSPE